MIPASIEGLLWIAFTLIFLLYFQRRLQQELQILFFLLTRRADLAVALFSILFFPGVLLHEASHYLTAKILGVKTGRFSLVPSPRPDGKLQMGSVETARVDWFRDAFVGAAPLISGGILVSYIGITKLRIPELAEAIWADGFVSAQESIARLINQPDVWLWLYLALVISSTMIPSASDRQVWLPLGLFIAALLGASLLIGAGPWLLENLDPVFNRILKTAALVLGISSLLHLFLLPFVWMFRKLVGRFLDLDVVL